MIEFSPDHRNLADHATRVTDYGRRNPNSRTILTVRVIRKSVISDHESSGWAKAHFSQKTREMGHPRASSSARPSPASGSTTIRPVGFSDSLLYFSQLTLVRASLKPWTRTPY